MPFKDRERKLAYQREWYAAHRDRVIAKVHRRKWTLYAGTCEICGATTSGDTKGAGATRCAKHKNRLRREKV
jgi:hypothetical protein